MPDERMSEFFHWGEVTRSEKAIELGIDNALPVERRRDARLLHDKILYPLRHFLGRPVHVSSWYRSPALNRAVGGAEGSYHRRARAADVYVHGATAYDLTRLCAELALPYDKLINEFGRWLHVQIAMPGARPRLQIMTAHRASGRIQYASGLLEVDPVTEVLV